MITIICIGVATIAIFNQIQNQKNSVRPVFIKVKANNKR